MKLEIEKKYHITEHDYAIIQDNFKLIKSEEIKDYYLDTANFILTKKGYYLRLRNGKYELKIIQFHPETMLTSSEEIEEESEIEGILEQLFGLDIETPQGILYVETFRESYKTQYKGYSIVIDIDIYQYGKRYEIEILSEIQSQSEKLQKEQELSDIIDDFRNSFGLTGESNIDASKTLQCALYQNIELYEIMCENK